MITDPPSARFAGKSACWKSSAPSVTSAHCAVGKAAGLILLLLASACGHPKQVAPAVRERTYYGLNPNAQDGDALCVPAEDLAGPPVVCKSIAEIKRYIRSAQYAP